MAQPIPPPLFKPYGIQVFDPTPQVNPLNEPICKTFQNQIDTMIQELIPQIRDITPMAGANIPPTYVERQIIASNYMIPELFILNSKLYQAYVKRNNLIFSYLQNHEDFYRMSEFYLSHENPNIRSINKLLRDNQTKAVDNVSSQWIEEFKIAFENIRKLQEDNEKSILRNLITYINYEKTEYQLKATQYQNLKNEITLLKKKSGVSEDKTLAENKTDNIDNPDIVSKITDIEIILFRLGEKTNKKLSEYITLSNQYNENRNTSNSVLYENIIQNVNEVINLYQEDDQNFISLTEILTQIQGLSKIEDDEKRTKQSENLQKRLDGILTVKKNIMNKLKEIIENKKSKSNFYNNYLESLIYVKCIEMQMIQFIGKSKNKEKCDNRDIKLNSDQFQINARQFISRRNNEIQNQITQIEQKDSELTSTNTNSQLSEITRKIGELREEKRRIIEEDKQRIRDEIGRLDPSKPQNQTRKRDLDAKDDKLDKRIEAIDSEIKDLEKNETRLKSDKKSANAKKSSFEKLKTQKKDQQTQFKEKIQKLFFSMGDGYVLIQRVNNLFIVMQKKKDEMDKKKSNNRLLQAMQNDMLYKEIKSLFKVEVLPESRYKLKILKSEIDFKKRIPILKKYFEAKNKFYENRGSILSALTFNMNNVVSAFTNNSPKNISFNKTRFGDLFTSNSTSSAVPTYNPTTPPTQTQFGAPAPMAYSPMQQPSTLPMGVYQRGGATEIKNVKSEKKPISSYEFITILDKVFEDLKTKVRSNEVYENRLKSFIEFLDQRDKELNQEILIKLQRVEKISKPKYEFLFPAQIRFLTRRILRIQQFMETPRNNSQMKHIYMTDFILMYFSLHYILSNFLDFILKPQKFNEMNS